MVYGIPFLFGEEEPELALWVFCVLTFIELLFK